ncbi:hypothetical protein MYU51_010379 [Penicillium brevicompactum]|uniref:uncharacterized protein n=1 Tax=Penicillium brevicompactum TaxID=5074 RepID=UPI002540E0CC|nr:uncharacterized protein N7506_009394 [Penicillium brevicompactum]KAJ5326292.1 hypothetical protein N7506_009394 [Penicillium brevicompactum]
MHVSTIITSLAIAMLPAVAVADWAELKDQLKLSSCGTVCSSILPAFSNDSFDDICNKLVEDGCAKAMITGDNDVGSIGFAKNGDVSCDDAKPAGQLTCTNAFREVVSSSTGFGKIGGTRSQQKSIYNADGVELGAIAMTGACLPIGETNACS